MSEHDERMVAASTAVMEQAMKFEVGIPVDPDVAEFMGAFEEKAISATSESPYEHSGEQSHE